MEAWKSGIAGKASSSIFGQRIVFSRGNSVGGGDICASERAVSMICFAADGSSARFSIRSVSFKSSRTICWLSSDCKGVPRAFAVQISHPRESLPISGLTSIICGSGLVGFNKSGETQLHTLRRGDAASFADTSDEISARDEAGISILQAWRIDVVVDDIVPSSEAERVVRMMVPKRGTGIFTARMSVSWVWSRGCKVDDGAIRKTSFL